MESRKKSSGTTSPSRWIPYRSVGLLSVLALAGVLVAVILWQQRPLDGTLEFELAKSAIQVAAGAGIGSLAAIAIFQYQEYRRGEALDRERAREKTQRAADKRFDARERQDELIKTILRDTLSSYHDVKRARRMLFANIADGADGTVKIDFYDDYFGVIMDAQLEYESLNRLAPLLVDNRIDLGLVKQSYRGIEAYLNDLIGEYKSNRHRVQKASNGIPVAQLPRLLNLLQGMEFVVSVSGPIDALLEELQSAILRPVDPYVEHETGADSRA